jgi:hypothetical protein
MDSVVLRVWVAATPETTRGIDWRRATPIPRLYTKSIDAWRARDANLSSRPKRRPCEENLTAKLTAYPLRTIQIDNDTIMKQTPENMRALATSDGRLRVRTRIAKPL